MSTFPASLSLLLGRPGVRSFARPHRGASSAAPRAMVEPLEDRQFFSVAPVLAAPAAPLKTQTAIFANKLAKNGTTTLIPLKIDAIKLVDGVLNAVGSIGGQAFSLPITLDTSPNPDPANDCPILHLALGPINLDLLGLNVDTSKICLDITAEEGSGNLLGNLLCDVSHLLDGGGTIGGILGGLLGTQVNDLLTGLTNLLNGALGRILSPTSLIGTGSSAAAAPGVTDILNLSVGPVDLNLLGLDVSLDNCAGGPVTVDITAESGPGNLLGNLLGGVAHLLDNPSNPNALANLLGRVSTILRGLL